MSNEHIQYIHFTYIWHDLHYWNHAGFLQSHRASMLQFEVFLLAIRVSSGRQKPSVCSRKEFTDTQKGFRYSFCYFYSFFFVRKSSVQHIRNCRGVFYEWLPSTHQPRQQTTRSHREKGKREKFLVALFVLVASCVCCFVGCRWRQPGAAH